MPTVPRTDTANSRRCLLVHGPAAGPDWWQSLQAALPAGLVLATTQADCPLPRVACLPAAPGNVGSLLRQARAHCPDVDVILLRAGTMLPPQCIPRLCAALQGEVLAASPLDDAGSWDPRPAGSDAAAQQIDALCRAYGRGLAIPCGDLSPLVSAWQGDLLAKLGDSELDAVATSAASLPGRYARLDTLYVAGAARTAAGTPSPALGELRARLAQALASEDFSPPLYGFDGRPVVLHVLHGWGGGAERFVRDLAAGDQERSHLVLRAFGSFPQRSYGQHLALHDGSLRGPALRELALLQPIADTALAQADWQAFFARLLADYRVDALIVSSLIGHSLDALRTRLPTAVVAHDCYPLWPLLHRDFGDPALPFDAAQRTADLAAADAQFEFARRDAGYWQRLRMAYVEAVLAARAQLFAPSQAALRNLLRLAPEFDALPAAVIPHGLAAWPVPAALAAPPARPRLRLVVPGRVRRGKGAELLAALLPELREHAELFLLGAGAEGQDFFGAADVHIVLNYPHAELPALLAAIQPDAALLLPTVAETFSYTLSECWSLGLPVIATRVGALAERISHGRNGFLADPQPAAVLECVRALAAAPQQLAAVRGQLAQETPRDLAQMAAGYAHWLPARPAAPLAPSRLATAEEIELLVLHGSQQQLRGQLAAKHTQIDDQQRELDARADWANDLDRQLRRQQRETGRVTREAGQQAEQHHREYQQLLTVSRTEIERLAAEGEQITEWLKRTQDDYSSLEEEFERRTRWALNLQSELAIAHGSVSWRITRPMRYAMRKLRALRARLVFSITRSLGLWQRMRGSLQRRGLGGTVQRALREFRRSRPPVVPVLEGAPPQPQPRHFEEILLPAAEQPQVSIVIPVYNKIAYTLACLKSLVEHAGTARFEVIVVDDCSSDDTAEHLAEVDNLRLVRNAQNLGFVGSCNAGAAVAQGEFLLFLNNDTVVTPGWLEALLACFAECRDAGLVGAKLVYPDGRLQEAGGIVFRDASGWNYGRFEDPADPRYNFRREADYCSGAAILLRRALFDQLGGFDRRYAPAYYEDTDLAFAVRAAGLKVYYEPRSTVIHFEGITAGTDTGSGMKRYQVVNKEKFLEKWKDELARQPAPINDAADAPRAATFRSARRLLVIDACMPTPDQDSGSLRMVNLMRLLRALGWQVTFFADNRQYLDGYTPALQALGVEAQYAPYMNDPVKFFRQRGAEFDAILLSRHYIAINYLGLARLYAPRARLIFDTVDLHYLREQRAAELENSEELRRKAERTRAQEQKLIRECDATLVVSPVEQALLAQELPQARVHILSNVHEVFGCRRPFAQRRDLVFVGSFQHPPNEDAMLWFARDIFPRVRAALPEIRLHVIGQPVPAVLREFESEHLLLHGFVADLEPYMDGCRISVAPLRYGAGVKGKVNMAMSYGLPVVATPAAVEGMHIQAGSDVLVADSAEAFADAVIRLHDDEALWQRLSASGLANVERHFSFDAAKKALQQILD